MRVLVLVPGPWKIVAELEDRAEGRCSLVDDILGLGANYARTRAALVAQIQLVAQDGPQGKPWIEPASSTEPKVYKFVKGDLRLYFVFEQGRLLLCGRCVVKKTQKTEKQHAKHALCVHARYLKALEDQELEEIVEHDLQKIFRPD